MGPRDRHPLPLVRVLLPLDIRVPTLEHRVAVVLHSVRRELRLLGVDPLLRLVRLVPALPAPRLEELLVVLSAHHVEVMVPGEDDRLSVRRHAGPGRVVVGRLPVLEFAQHPSVHIVLEVEHLLPCAPALLLALLLFLVQLLHLRFRLVFLLILRGFDLELEGARVDELDRADREVLAVPRVARDAGQLGRDPVVVEDLPLRPGHRVHDGVEGAVRRLPFVPERL